MNALIRPTPALFGRTRVPTSKPHMQRALILALLTEGTTELLCPSWSSETRRLLGAMKAFGLEVREEAPERLLLRGAGRELRAPQEPLHAGGSAFMFRTAAALAGLVRGTTIVEGDRAMKRRPVLQFLNFVTDLGAELEDLSDDLTLRVRIRGASSFGGRTTVDTAQSSQFLTSLLLISPLADTPVTIGVPDASPVGEGYVDLTLAMMGRRGAVVVHGPDGYEVRRGAYRPAATTVPSDFTALSYLAGAALSVPRAEIAVEGYVPSEMSSEREFLAALRRLGLEQDYDPQARRLRLHRAQPVSAALEIDGRNIPTVIPALAGAAPFVESSVTIRGAGHINNHKCQRLYVVIDQLRRLGCDVEPLFTPEGGIDGLTTRGRQQPRGGASLESFGDHRVFAGLLIAALAAQEPTTIRGAEHLDAGFPGFLDTVQDLVDGGAAHHSLASGDAVAAAR